MESVSELRKGIESDRTGQYGRGGRGKWKGITPSFFSNLFEI